jgi:mRNA interferase MazF
MVIDKYIPDRGDVVWLDFDPAKGHEERGSRPALVISPTPYNKKTDMALVCPITSTAKGYPFEELLESKEITGVVLVDQIRCVDWSARSVRFIIKGPSDLIARVLHKLQMLTK